MKERFLNLNSVGGKILAVIGVLLFGIPSCGCLMERVGIYSNALGWIIRVSLWTGVGLLLLFILLILFEQILDARLFQKYRMTLRKRISIGDGCSECPNCGSRRIRDFESTCPVCGKEISH